ncbi:MAG: flagellar motor protein MotB, partial [Methyloligellaceae bacterium]
MSSETEETPQEIIVVRKYNVGDGGHHGGAWKIAYADFMTAMMALFLVLWLVNASDDETKAHVASYFNPVKLRDTVTGAKGLEKLEPGPSKNVKGLKSEGANPGKGGDEGNGDAAMLRDPYEALDELAAQAKAAVLGAIGDEEYLSITAEGRKGGEAFKDPFDPSFWRDSLAASDDQRELRNAEAEQQKISNDLATGGMDKDGRKRTESAISPASE